MPELKDLDSRFSHINRKVFVLAVLTALIVVVALYFMATQKDIFEKKIRLKFIYNTATGFTENMSVKLAGFRIGKVKTVVMDDNAKVVVTLELLKKYQKWLRMDTVAKLSKENYIGDSVIEVNFGDPKQPMLEDGGIIKFEKARGIEEIAQEIVAELKPVALNVKDFVEKVTSPQGDVAKTLKNSAELTGGLVRTNNDIRQTIAGVQPILRNAETISGDVKGATKDIPLLTKQLNSSLANVETATVKIQTMIENVNASTRSIRDELPSILRETNKTLKNVEKITSEIAKESPRIRPLLQNTQDITDDTKDITGALKNNWFLRNSLTPNIPPPAITPRTIREPKR